MMFALLTANLGTILITAALIVTVVLIVRVIRKEKRQGVSSCGGSCGHCPMSGQCLGGAVHRVGNRKL